MRRTLLAVSLVLVALTAQAAPTPTTTTTTTSSSANSLQQARIDAAKTAYKLHESRFAAGTATARDLYEWSRHLYEAEHDGGVKSAGADHLTRMQKLQSVVELKYKAASADSADVAAAKYYVAEAQVWK